MKLKIEPRLFPAILLVLFILMSSNFGYAGWITNPIGQLSGLSGIACDITIGDGRNDGINRIYLSDGVNYIYEFTWTGSSWTQKQNLVMSDNNFLYPYKLAIGQLRDDAKNRLYITSHSNNYLYEYEWNGNSWVQSESVKVGSINGLHELNISALQNDGRNRVYVRDAYNYIYEITFTTTIPTVTIIPQNTLVSATTFAIGKCRNDNIRRIYATDYNTIVNELTWSSTSGWVGSSVTVVGNGYIYDIVIGDLRNDGVERIYFVKDDSNLYEVTLLGTSTFVNAIMPSYLGYYWLKVEIGSFRNDGINRIYAFDYYDNQICEFTWTGTTWTVNSIINNINSQCPMSYGMTRDNNQYLYVASLDRVIYELSYSTQVYSIKGLVKDKNGIPLPGITVYLQGVNTATTTTDVNGNYEFNGISGDNYTLYCSSAGLSFAPEWRTYSPLISSTTNQDFTVTTPKNIFFENWESGQFISTKWAITGTPKINVKSFNQVSGSYSLNLDWTGDIVTSNPIDLSLYTTGYLSFFYKQGSPWYEYLALDFKLNTGWYEVWSTTGLGERSFDFSYISISLPAQALHNNFSFRFRSCYSYTYGNGDYFIDDILLSTVTYNISGFVKTSTGVALSNIPVTLVLLNQTYNTVFSSANGYYELTSLLPLSYSLVVSSSNWDFTPSHYTYIPLDTNYFQQNFIGVRDSTPPSAITDLSAVAASGYASRVTLNWTAPGDDGTVGDIINGKYDIRFSTNQNDGWNSSNVVSQSISMMVGTKQILPITNLSPNTTYYFWLKMADYVDNSNWSEISNTTAVVTKSIYGTLVSTGIVAGSYRGMNCMACDDAGNLYVAYCSKKNTGNITQVYVAKSNDNGQTWQDINSAPIYYSTDTNQLEVQLVIDSSDVIHCIWREDNDTLKYSKYFNSQWTIPMIISQNVKSLGNIAVDSENNLHLIWEDYWQNYYRIVYNKFDVRNSTWTGNVVLDNGRRPLLAIDSHNRPHVIYIKDFSCSIFNLPDYYTTFSGTVYYCFYTGKRWTKPVPTDTSGDSPTFVIDSQDRVYVCEIKDAYCIIYASFTPNIGWSNWKYIYTNSMNNREPRVIIDTQNKLNILWLGKGTTTGDSFRVKYVKSTDSGTWTTPITLNDYLSNTPFSVRWSNFNLNNGNLDFTWTLRDYPFKGDYSLMYGRIDTVTLSSGAVFLPVSGNDLLPPAPVTDLTATLTTAEPKEIKLTWTVSGADGTIGNILDGQFRLEYATTPVTNALVVSTETWSFYAVNGSSQTTTITGLVLDTTYYFRLRVADEMPNWSEVSNMASIYVPSLFGFYISSAVPIILENISGTRRLVANVYGDLFIAYTKQFGDKQQIFVAKSTNGGQNWYDIGNGPIQNISGFNQYYPTLVIDSSGTLHCIWSGTDSQTTSRQIKYSRYDGVSWLPWVNISPITNKNYEYTVPNVDIDSQNNLHLVCNSRDMNGIESDQIVYSKYNISISSWSSWYVLTDVLISGYSQHDPSISVDSYDRVHIVWSGRDSTVGGEQVKYCNFDGVSWSSWTNIQTTPGYDQRYPQIAVDNKNYLHIVYSGRSLGMFDYQIKYSSYVPGTGWSQWAYVQPTRGYAQTNPNIAIDSDDRAHIIWVAALPGINGLKLQYSYQNSTGGWTTTQTFGNDNCMYPTIRWTKNNTYSDGLDFAWTYLNYGQQQRFYRLNVRISTGTFRPLLCQPVNELEVIPLNNRKVKLSWIKTVSDEVVAYRIYVTTFSSDNYDTCLATVPVTEETWVSDSLTADKYYWFTVRSVDLRGNIERNTNVVGIGIKSELNPVAIIKSPANGQKISGNSVSIIADILNSDSNNNITQIQFQYCSTDSINWSDIGSPDTNEPYFIFWDASTLPDRKQYRLRAVVFNWNGGSNESTSPWLTITIDHTEPDIVEQITVAAKSEKIVKIDNRRRNLIRFVDGENNTTGNLLLPAGSLTNSYEQLKILVKPYNPPALAQNYISVGPVLKLDLTQTNMNLLNNEATLTWHYQDIDGDNKIDGYGIKTRFLNVCYYDSFQQQWIKTNTVNNINNKTISAKLKHFSYWGVFALLPTDVSNVYCYPNPYYSGRDLSDSGICFTNIPLGKSKVRIFNIAGELVYEEEKEINIGDWYWNAKNSAGERVASGVYLFMLTNERTPKSKISKFAIIR